MLDRLRIGVHSLDGTTLVIPEGEIDLATRDELRATLRRCHGKVVVDLARVTFLDSSGIGTLVAERNRLVDGGGDLSVRDPIDLVDTALRLVGLADWIEA